VPLGFAQRARSGAGEREVTSRPPATNGQRFTMSRGEETLVLESLQRGVQGADGVVAPGSRGEIASDGEAVRLVLEPGYREQGGEFERSESCNRHYSQFVGQIQATQVNNQPICLPAPTSLRWLRDVSHLTIGKQIVDGESATSRESESQARGK